MRDASLFAEPVIRFAARVSDAPLRKNSGVTRFVVASSATCLAPFSQNSKCERSPSGSGQAQPGQSNPSVLIQLQQRAHSARTPISFQAALNGRDNRGHATRYFAERFDLDQIRYFGRLGTRLGGLEIVVWHLDHQNFGRPVRAIVVIQHRAEWRGVLTEECLHLLLNVTPLRQPELAGCTISLCRLPLANGQCSRRESYVRLLRWGFRYSRPRLWLSVNRTTSALPPTVASISGVMPLLPFALTLAPRSVRRRTASRLPLYDAPPRRSAERLVKRIYICSSLERCFHSFRVSLQCSGNQLSFLRGRVL